MMAAVTHPMWSLLFRSKATIEKDLAVERTRRQLLEQEIQDLRERLERAETEKARLIDAVLLKQGTINAPLRVESTPPESIASYIAAMGVQEIGKPRHNSSAPSMPDE